MADAGKITALKTATKNLLTQLQASASQNGDVYVSIVPFVKDVAVDPVNYNANWVDWTDWDAANPTLGSCSKSGYNSRSSCTAAGTCSASGYNTQNSCTAAGTCSLSGYTTQSTCVAQNVCSDPSHTSHNSCTNHNGTWGPAVWTSAHATWTFATWTPDHSQWNGCITDRGNSNGPSSGNYDTNATAPTTTITASLFPAEQYDSCPQPVKGLNYNWTSMTTLVNNMSPNGNTNQGIGLAWGWQSLVGGGPFTVPAKDPNYKYNEVIILLTDGLNTENRWYTSQNSIDTREKLTCDNIYAAGITLYTIQVNTGGDPTSTLLQNCAGSPPDKKYPDSSKFFLLTSASAMVTTFNQIGTALSNLRVAK
jgi:hypothetical protein